MSETASKNAGRLNVYFTNLESAVIAFSGGVDSSVLAKTAYESLGKKVLAVTIDSPTIDRTELSGARNIAKEIGIKHIIFEHDELENECFRRNEPDRCYHCKKGILGLLKDHAKEHGYQNVIEGTNAEEMLGHRPGYRAVKEEGVLSPLADLGLRKKEVREIAVFLGLSNAQKPSTACLSSRIPHGIEITKGLLEKVSKAEKIVRSTGVKQLRVRSMGEIAVIEVAPEDFGRVIEKREWISRELKELGYRRAVIDIEGYKTGSMSR